MLKRHLILAVATLSLSACDWFPALPRGDSGPRVSLPVTSASVPLPGVVTAKVAPARATTAAAPTTEPVRVRKGQGAASTVELRGRVQLQAGRGQQLHAGEEVDTVVYFVPARGAPPPRSRRVDVVTKHRDFRPTALALPLGSTVTFVNQDDVRHNVFSVTPGAAFNLGYRAAGTRTKHRFASPGLVLLGCNVHHSMEMDVFVVPSAYAARVAADGSFVLHGLPPGQGELVAWNPRARLLRRALIPNHGSVVLSLLAERPRVVTIIDVGAAP